MVLTGSGSRASGPSAACHLSSVLPRPSESTALIPKRPGSGLGHHFNLPAPVCLRGTEMPSAWKVLLAVRTQGPACPPPPLGCSAAALAPRPSSHQHGLLRPWGPSTAAGTGQGSSSTLHRLWPRPPGHAPGASVSTPTGHAQSTSQTTPLRPCLPGHIPNSLSSEHLKMPRQIGGRRSRSHLQSKHRGKACATEGPLRRLPRGPNAEHRNRLGWQAGSEPHQHGIPPQTFGLSQQVKESSFYGLNCVPTIHRLKS